MECRGFCRRLGLRVREVPLLRLYYSSARFLQLSRIMALIIALYALDFPVKRIAFAMSSRGCTVREAIREGRRRIGACDRGDCVRILQERTAAGRREYQRFGE